jgi:decaprenylphospho-beta-D-ribofuranose 2-oxidase
MFRARWAERAEAPPQPPRPKRGFALPMNLPTWTLNRMTARAFNGLHFRTHPTRPARLIHPEVFFYPLDAVRHWNRVYGKKGFTQYQCVIPHSSGTRALTNSWRWSPGPAWRRRRFA